MTQNIDPLKKMNWFDRIAHPGQFLKWSRYLILPLAILSAILFGVGLWFAFFNSPEDYQMGDTVRIMYIHVPNAWLSQLVYVMMAVSAIGTLVWRHPLADVAMKAAAPLGAAFTTMALFTGALWGRPTWGTYWEWDGRMTATLILLLMYLGIIALWRSFDDQLRAAKLIAIIVLVGTINIPIIKFSVDWWNTLHQPSIVSSEGLSMPASIYTPLLIMMLAFTVLFALLQTNAMRTEILRRKADRQLRKSLNKENG
ncbi:MAG: heme ABC transporter permease [Devosiaceae bacterium]|nr:heme ABC transporter permease [Devosiaceae bacterium]